MFAESPHSAPDLLTCGGVGGERHDGACRVRVAEELGLLEHHELLHAEEAPWRARRIGRARLDKGRHIEVGQAGSGAVRRLRAPKEEKVLR